MARISLRALPDTHFRTIASPRSPGKNDPRKQASRTRTRPASHRLHVPPATRAPYAGINLLQSDGGLPTLMRFHQSILNFAGGRYLKAACLLSAAAIALYVWYEPPLPHPKAYGGTWVGYTLGSVAAGLVLWLLVLGVRKRSYRSTLGTVQGWTSAHVYLGLTVLLLATLHSAFEFGWNIHTYAYALLVIVVCSGISGVYVYLRCPKLVTKNLGEDNLRTLALKITDLDDQCAQLAVHLPDSINAAVRQASPATIPKRPLCCRPPTSRAYRASMWSGRWAVLRSSSRRSTRVTSASSTF